MDFLLVVTILLFVVFFAGLLISLAVALVRSEGGVHTAAKFFEMAMLVMVLPTLLVKSFLFLAPIVSTETVEALRLTDDDNSCVPTLGFVLLSYCIGILFAYFDLEDRYSLWAVAVGVIVFNCLSTILFVRLYQRGRVQSLSLSLGVLDAVQAVVLATSGLVGLRA